MTTFRQCRPWGMFVIFGSRGLFENSCDWWTSKVCISVLFATSPGKTWTVNGDSSHGAFRRLGKKTNKKNPKVVSLWFSTARAIARPSHYTFSHVQKKSSSTVKKLFLFRLNSARQKKLWNSLAINNCRSRRRAKLNHFPIDNQPIGKGLSNKGVSHEFASINWEC